MIFGRNLGTCWLSLFFAVALSLNLSGCITVPEEPAAPQPAAAPELETSVLERLARMFSEQGFVTNATERGLVVYLPSLFFAVDSSALSIDAQEKVQSISEVMNRQAFSNLTIAVEGHTDSLGDAENNMELSRQRAETVADHLVFSNVSTNRINIGWFGETAPIEPNRNADGTDNPAGRAKNRRVELIVLTPAPDQL